MTANPFDPSRALAIAAGLVIVALTGAAFWLSYAHLAEVALAHGLGAAEERAWAWPATLDLFIVAGELLMLRAALVKRVDWWAIGLTSVGSLGSIVLNVAGVAGTRDPGAVPLLDYVVAAVPPTAALLAFGALMRQVHQALAGHVEVISLDVIQTDPPSEVQRVPEAYPAIETAVPAVPEPVPAGVRLLPIVARPEPLDHFVGTGKVMPVLAAEEPRTRTEVHAEYVPDPVPDEDDEDDEDIVDPDPLLPQARIDFAGWLTTKKRAPGVAALRTVYPIGQARAQRIRDALKEAL